MGLALRVMAYAAGLVTGAAVGFFAEKNVHKVLAERERSLASDRLKLSTGLCVLRTVSIVSKKEEEKCSQSA